MKIEGEYLYPESPLEASVFLDCEFEYYHQKKWQKRSQSLCEYDIAIMSLEAIRIHRSVAVPKLEYREGEPGSCVWGNQVLVYDKSTTLSHVNTL